MRYIALILAITTAILIPVVVFPARTPAWVSGEQIFAAVAIGPLLLICLGLIFYSGIRYRSSESRFIYVIIFLASLALPGTLIGKYVILKSGNLIYWNHKNAWLAEGNYINPILLKYYQAFPDRFHKKQYTEQVDVDGFIDFLKAEPSFRDSKIRIKGNSILDPWGRPIEYLLDQNGDNQLYGRTESIWIGTSEPVTAAVGLLLSEPSQKALQGYEYIYGENGYTLR